MTVQAQAAVPAADLSDAILRVEMLWGDRHTFVDAVREAADEVGVDEGVLRRCYIDLFNANRPCGLWS